jgi:hypothetical protein
MALARFSFCHAGLAAPILAALIVSGCGTPRHEGCSVEELADGSARITCPDGSSAVVSPGTDGETGAPGASCTVEDLGDGVRRIRCEDGSEALVHDGSDGEDGDPGSSCIVEDLGEGVRRIRCDDGSEVLVHDGTDGNDGDDGADGVLVEIDEEPPGHTCAEGGLRIRVGRDLDGDGTLDSDEVEKTHYLCGDLELAEHCGLLNLEEGYRSPGDEETEVLPIAPVRFHLEERVDALSLTLSRHDDGTQVAGTLETVPEVGGAVFDVDGLLAPSTTYDVIVTVTSGDCLAEETWSFTTSSLGAPLDDEASIIGRTWLVDLSTGSGDLTSFGVMLRLQALDLDPGAPGGKTLDVILASDQEGAQDTCHATTTATADFELSPYFVADGGRFEVSLGIGPLVLRSWRLSGLFHSDLSAMGGVIFEGLVDVAEVAAQVGYDPEDLCSLYESLGLACEPCPDDPEAPCAPMRQERADGAETSEAVIPVASDQTENHLCPYVCENEVDDDGDGLVDDENPECDPEQWP